MESDVITIGEYIIIQRQNYKKLHKFNKTSSCITLGRDNIELSGIEGCPYYSVFKMIPKSNKKNRLYGLQLTNETADLRQDIDIKVSGVDNRNILDDGRSQKLSAAEIEELKSESTSASDIVGSLISNSNTFHNKTEYSQEKYLKKKEKKYFEYIQIVKPNIRVITEIMYRLDSNKIQGIRLDTLSQIICLSHIQSIGNHLLYDSGSNGLMAAALLSAIGENSEGKLLHMHPGNMSQKQALLAMNYKEEQLARCVSVNIYSALRQYYQGCDTNKDKTGNIPLDKEKSITNGCKRKAEGEIVHESKIAKLDNAGLISKEINDSDSNSAEQKLEGEIVYESKIAKLDNLVSKQIVDTVKIEDSDSNSVVNSYERKKPKWHFENLAAANLLKAKMDSLVIACKEDPSNIFTELVTFVKPGRPFVIFHSVAEPLQNLYLTLKPRSNIAALKLTCNWMRNYQVYIPCKVTFFQTCNVF